MFDGGLRRVAGPAQDQHVESRRVIEQPLVLEPVGGQPREPLNAADAIMSLALWSVLLSWGGFWS